jgi:hypothetical protein
MEEAICLCFYTMLCCVFCCPPNQPPLSSNSPRERDEVVVENPSSSASGVEKATCENPLKNESELKKDGPAV